MTSLAKSLLATGFAVSAAALFLLAKGNEEEQEEPQRPVLPAPEVSDLSAAETPIIAEESQQRYLAGLDAIVDENIELARQQYEISADGSLIWTADKPKSFRKKYRFSDGEEISLDFELLTHRDALADSDEGRFTKGELYNALDLAETGDEAALAWFYKNANRCKSLTEPSVRASQSEVIKWGCAEYDTEMSQILDALISEKVAENDVWAMQKRASQLLEDGFEREALEMDENLWKLGYISGLNGLMKPAGTFGEMGYDEQIDVASYYYASYVLTAAFYDGVPDELFGYDIQDFIEENVLGYLSESNLLDLERIEQRAKERLLANPSCCKGYLGKYGGD